jgi:hypothetical protein
LPDVEVCINKVNGIPKSTSYPPFLQEQFTISEKTTSLFNQLGRPVLIFPTLYRKFALKSGIGVCRKKMTIF